MKNLQLFYLSKYALKWKRATICDHSYFIPKIVIFMKKNLKRSYLGNMPPKEIIYNFWLSTEFNVNISLNGKRTSIADQPFY